MRSDAVCPRSPAPSAVPAGLFGVYWIGCTVGVVVFGDADDTAGDDAEGEVAAGSLVASELCRWAVAGAAVVISGGRTPCSSNGASRLRAVLLLICPRSKSGPSTRIPDLITSPRSPLRS